MNLNLSWLSSISTETVFQLFFGSPVTVAGVIITSIIFAIVVVYLQING